MQDPPVGPAWGAPSPRHDLPGLPLQAPRRRPSGQASTPPQDSGLPPGPSATPAAGLVPTCLSTWEPLSAPILPRPPRQTSQRRPRGWDVSVPGPGVPAQVPERLPGAGTPPRLLYALGSRPSVPQRPSSVRDAPPPRLETLHPLPKPLSDTPSRDRIPSTSPTTAPPRPLHPRGPQRLARDGCGRERSGRPAPLAQRRNFCLARKRVDVPAWHEAGPGPGTTRWAQLDRPSYPSGPL